MRIFIGLVEVCNIVFTYAKGFRSLGHETFTAVKEKEVFNAGSEYDVVVFERLRRYRHGAGLLGKLTRLARAWVILLSVFLKALVRCDVFIFIYGTGFLPRCLDYPILKMCNKRIVSVFLGSDIRYWYAYEQEMRSIGCEAEVQPFIEYQKSIPGSFDAKMELVRAAERYSDLILSQPDMAQLLSRPYMRVNLPIDLSQYRFNVTEREVPLVLHIPSNRDVKGTVHVLAAVQELAHKKLRFEFRLIENMPNDDVRNLLSDADIVVDALFMQTFGMLAIEALATGKSVLARYDARFSLFPPECPVINVNINNLTDRLGRVISDRGLRRRVGHEGRAYVEKHHSHVRVTQQIIDLLGSEHIRVYDFYPSFFKKNLVVPPELLEQERIREKRLKKTGRKLPLRIRRCVLWPLVLYHRE